MSFVIKIMLSWLRFFKNMTCSQLLVDYNPSKVIQLMLNVFSDSLCLHVKTLDQYFTNLEARNIYKSIVFTLKTLLTR